MTRRVLAFCRAIGMLTQNFAANRGGGGCSSPMKTDRGLGFSGAWGLVAVTCCSFVAATVPTITLSKPAALTGTPGLTASIPSGAASYAWTISNGAITSASTKSNSVAFTIGQPGFTTLNCIVIDVDGNSSISSASVTVVAQPNATISVPGYVGIGKPFNASVPAQNGATYAWTVDGNAVNATANEITLSSGNSRQCIVYCKVTNPLGMTASSTKIINVLPMPVLHLSGTCVANSVYQCQATPGLLDGYRYEWTISNGASLLGGGASFPYGIERGAARQPWIHATGPAGGTFSMACTVTDYVGQSVTATGTGTITANGGVGLPFFVTPGDSNVPAYLGQASCGISVNLETGGLWGSSEFEVVSQGSTDCIFNVPITLSSVWGTKGYITANGALLDKCTSKVLVTPPPTGSTYLTPPPVATITAPTMALEGAEGLVASVPYVGAPDIARYPGLCNYLWEISNGTITSGVGSNRIVFRAGNAGQPTNLKCKVISYADRTITGTFSTKIYPVPVAQITVPSLSEAAGATARVASVPLQDGASYAWTIGGGRIDGGDGTNVIHYTVTAPLGGNVVLTCAVKDGSGSKTSTGTQSVSVRAELVINEVGSSSADDASRWFEVHNVSAATLNLANYKLRCQAITKPSRQTTAITPSVIFDLPVLSIPAGGYAVIRGIAYNYLQFSGLDLACVDNSDHTTMPYWNANGFIELINNGSTVDFVRFGNSSESPTNIVAWPMSTNAPALPLAYGQSLARNLASTSTGTAADWKLHTIATFGGPNDVVVDTASDGDGIPDECKAPGKTFAGLPLYDWGARKGQKDVFIHIDYMDASKASFKDDPGITPQKAALDKVVTLFSRHAVPNIALHIDVGTLFSATKGDIAGYNLDGKSHMVTYQVVVDCPSSKWSNLAPLSDVNNLHFIKALSMPLAEKQIFHYVLFGDSQPAPKTGSSGIAELPGNDCAITLGSFGKWDLNTMDAANTNRLINTQAATLLHEFGHNLGLQHGGSDDVNWKPNYYSTMNYLYQVLGLSTTNPEDRYYFSRCIYLKDPVFTGSSTYSKYTTWNSVVNGPETAPINFVMDYSNGSGGLINEKNVNETKGIMRTESSASIDFNGDGSATQSGFRFDVNGNGITTVVNPDGTTGDESYGDYDDWGQLTLLFDTTIDGDSSGVSQLTANNPKMKHIKRIKAIREKIKSKTDDEPKTVLYEIPLHLNHKN